jgi:hypothetical protein
MKKLQLNKETIARLNNPGEVYGGVVTYSYDGNMKLKPTCLVCEAMGTTEFSNPNVCGDTGTGAGAAC